MLRVGLDVGSTTVKAVVLDEKGNVVWKDYQRHRTKQVEKALEFLERIKKELNIDSFKLFTVGSGGQNIAELLGGKFVQEVNAVAYAVEKLFPNASSVFELGGQDAKFIVWLRDEKGVRKFASMNDKCAGGTGATIDRILAKLNIPPERASRIRYSPEKVHPVAGKCGVFAETDINSLQKSGVPEDELLISLFDAVVLQNLTVLTRGYTPRPPVLLLGGPNNYFPALREAWEYHLKKLWKERGIKGGEVFAPQNALYFAALGAALLGDFEDGEAYKVKDLSPLYKFLEEREKLKAKTGQRGLWKTKEELREFLKRYKPLEYKPPQLKRGEKISVYIGVDGGSTSTKGVVLNEKGELLTSAYKLSEGNPIEDAKEILKRMHEELKSKGVELEVKGVGFTGYAKDLLKAAFGGDVAIVETVAHTLGALHFFPDAEVICDVGGQDIKIIILRDGKVQDFKLNTQCSAGNGYYLQATANRFGYRVEDYAEVAFKAEYAPAFNFGCAVFLEADIVNFQRLGWTAEEIMAGLAKVLPLNVWLYVAQEPNLKRLGKVFVLQGGTHKNLAVVKAQVDYIKSKVPDAKVYLHPFGGMAGAYGAALEAKRVVKKSTFVGLEKLDSVKYDVKRGEETRCDFCKNRCIRTFIDLKIGDQKRRFIIATCDKGEVESREELKLLLGRRGKLREKYPNFAEISNRLLFKSYKPKKVLKEKGLLNLFRKEKLEKLKNTVVGIPRVLNIYSLAPFFGSYFEALGVKKVIFSDYTDEELYRKGAQRGSIDPCFPSKVALAHVYNLLYEKSANLIFFPCVRTLSGEIYKAEGHWACPTVAATPEVVKAAFTKERDEFKERGVLYLDPVLDFEDLELLERQLYKTFSKLWGITKEENREAMEEGLKALKTYREELQKRALKVIKRLEEEGNVGIVVLSRPYHKDPGLNHGILEELNKLGYPIFTIESLPRDREFLEKLFKEELEKGLIEDPMDIRDLWKKCYSENSSLKVWAARFAAKHPNLAAVDLSSFRCGHDAPIYSVIEEIVERSGVPYFTFHEIDENRPSGSIKIRVETIDYFLKERMREMAKREKKTG